MSAPRRRRLPRKALPIGLALAFALSAPTGCKSVCQKFADHLEDCRQTYCETRLEHPICSQRYAERDNAVDDCPEVLEPVVEEQLAKDCDTLAREMGWVALENLP